ncbi:MAG: hypothetical protein EPO32_11940 [Anaerolineae bacterium]|nr:MAG: hypothetical protein EPO32_11940 [Anaerolineae bacterium]
MPGKNIRGGRPSSPFKGVSSRPSASIPRRGASPQRIVNRAVKRTEVRKSVFNVNPRPRPEMRPSAPPPRVMNKVGPPMGSMPKPQAVLRPGSPKGLGSRPMPPSARPASGIPQRQRTGAAAGYAAGTAWALNTGAAPADLSSELSSLQYSLDELHQRASFAQLDADVAGLDSNLNHAINLLEGARDAGYKYQGDLEDIAYTAMTRWQQVRQQVGAKIQQSATAFRGQLGPMDNYVRQLNMSLGSSSQALGAIGTLRNEINQALGRLGELERSIESSYDEIERAAGELTTRLTAIHWMLGQAAEASFPFESDENLYRGVKARWDYEGDQDPEGILFLTNKRLIFERKEKVATKKVLFITTAKELVQQLMIGQALANVKDAKAQNKGLFGHQDFLDVIFSDSKIGSVAFHIDGQASDDWVRFIKDAKSGKIEDERAKASKLSFSDLTGELTQAHIVELQNEVNELQDEMMLKNLATELNDLENEVQNLGRQLSKLRGRGYAIEKSLEADVQVLAAQWEKIKERAHGAMDMQVKLLSDQMKSIQSQTATLAGMSANLAAARPAFMQLKSAIASAEAQAEAAEETVLDQYDEYADEIESLHAHFAWLDWMMDALATASFKLNATESGVAAVEAVWERPGMDPENGILFLTEQRFLWEDRVGDFELKFDVALDQILDIKEEENAETGMDTLVASLGKGAPVPNARFALAQPLGDEWLKMIGRARSGGYADDRAVEIDPALLERIRNAPTQCKKCGGAFTAPVLRGQTEITCEFCGTVTRI